MSHRARRGRDIEIDAPKSLPTAKPRESKIQGVRNIPGKGRGEEAQPSHQGTEAKDPQRDGLGGTVEGFGRKPQTMTQHVT